MAEETKRCEHFNYSDPLVVMTMSCYRQCAGVRFKPGSEELYTCLPQFGPAHRKRRHRDRIRVAEHRRLNRCAGLRVDACFAGFVHLFHRVSVIAAIDSYRGNR